MHMTELPKLSILAYGEVDVTITDVGETFADESSDDFLHQGNRVCSLDVEGWAFDIEHVHVLKITLCLAPPEFVPWQAYLLRPAKDIVIDVSHVLNILDGISL